MKLDDFLKCKKVRCVSIGNYSFLTVAREYHVIGVYKDSAIVVNDNYDEGVYPYEYFEPVLATENPLQGMELTPEFEVVVPHVSEFKAGDPVYWGLESRIFKVCYFMSKNVLVVELDGTITFAHKYELCLATQENYELLCKLYPHIEFEQPPVTGGDLARAMARNGHKYIVGKCGDYIGVFWWDEDAQHFFDMDGTGTFDVEPIDPRTGESLTQAVLDE